MVLYTNKLQQLTENNGKTADVTDVNMNTGRLQRGNVGGQLWTETSDDVMYDWDHQRPVTHVTPQLRLHGPRHVRRHGVYMEHDRRVCTAPA